ncbi:MAG: hypothetical protein HY581_05230 [Nitrospirae bacterium]|nr:hypothetical protein [Nitrospirota bacterium]
MSVPDPTSPSPDQTSKRSPHDEESGGGEDRYLNVAVMMVGVAMMFIGFLDILLSISGGFELAGVTPLLIYFVGLALWAYATITAPTIRYSVMAGALVVALAFFHYGEILFWHKQVVFWFTVALVTFFMFKTAGKP